ncbi:Cys-tRNA(Pro) deacylase [Ferdinandcohnia sp. Marseille-Q9671]
MAKGKTNAMRILDSKNIHYTIFTYESNDGKIDGVSVAHKIGIDPKKVFKTLVAQGNSNETFVFIIPVEQELDLKKAAKAAGVKKVEMLPVKDIQKLTGYIRGGCSPIGMKKSYPTFIELTANQHDSLIVSAGKIGMQLELLVSDLETVTDATIINVVKD